METWQAVAVLPLRASPCLGCAGGRHMQVTDAHSSAAMRAARRLPYGSRHDAAVRTAGDRLQRPRRLRLAQKRGRFSRLLVQFPSAYVRR